MRNQNKINQLSRTSSHRKAMMSNMAASLIEHKRITTTLAKAKALRGYVEPLITKSKSDTTHSRRMVFRKLQNKEAVTELFREVAPKIAARPGGYTRIIKIGFRQGDSAEMCMIELVDFNEIYSNDTKDASKKTRRSRRGSGVKSTTESNPEVKAKKVGKAEAASDTATEAEKPSDDTSKDEGESQEKAS